MNERSRMIMTVSLAALLLTALAVRADAQCAFPGPGVFVGRSASQVIPENKASLQAEEKDGGDDQIVGFWKVKFVSVGSPGIPDGTVVDNAFVQWHSDGTEIMNSSRPPATSNFCLGVWQRAGSSRYKLNHFALSSDLNGNMIGPAQIREDLVLDHHSNQYVGTFTIDQYDVSGNLLAHVSGRVTGKRITVDTAVVDVL